MQLQKHRTMRCSCVSMPSLCLLFVHLLLKMHTCESTLTKVPERSFCLMIAVGGEGDSLEVVCRPLRPHFPQQQLHLIITKEAEVPDQWATC